MKGSGITESSSTGEIINVQGNGRIIRATGKKDRHSKVYTSKGPRDRRVRLSAPTAIQFYDVQDRLGYDRPSKAVDWLINKAKHAIDNLSHTQSPHQVEVGVGVEEKNDELVPLTSIAGSSTVAGDSNFCSSLMPLPPPGARQPTQSQSSPSQAEVQDDESMMKSFFPMSSMNSTLLNNFSSSSSTTTGRIIHQTEKNLGLSLQTFQEQVPFHDNNYNYTNSGGVLMNSSSSAHSIVPTPPQGFYYNPYINSGFFSHHQREYNYSHLIHSSSWNDSRQFPSTNHEEHDHIQTTQSTSSSSLFSVHFGSNFQVPARIHGDDIAEPNSILHAPNNANTRNKEF